MAKYKPITPAEDIGTQKTISSVLVKPAGPDCNLHCAYCFYLDKNALYPGRKQHRMTDDILRELVKQVMQQGGRQVSFGWQGGEPTLMGREFFERTIAYQKKYGRNGQTVGNGLQTNGLLIDEDFARFLRHAGFLTGLSLDGPQHVHDKYRRAKGGQPSWERVVKARDLLLNVGAEVNALIVVNNYSVHFVEEIYNFHKKGGVTFMQFIPCITPAAGSNGRKVDFSAGAQEFGHFLCDLFDLWIGDFRYGQPTTSIRWFDSVLHTFVGLAAPECTLLEECGTYVVIEHNGDAFSCDFFVEPDWLLGNIMKDSLSGMLNSPKQAAFGARKKKVPPECYDCQWLKHCRCGCPHNWQYVDKNQWSNRYCLSYKMFFEHSHGRLQKLAEEWRAERSIAIEEEQPPVSAKRVGRNDPCPCGSERKFKYCCGKI
jgi:uncharacterized protein